MKALIACDLQLDAVNSVFPQDRQQERQAFFDRIEIALQAAKHSSFHDFCLICTGLQFDQQYRGVSPQHKLYGPFKKLHEKVGDRHCHWFLKGFKGSELLLRTQDTLDADNGQSRTFETHLIWRQSHMPSQDLIALLKRKQIQDVTIVGLRTSAAVITTLHALIDHSINVSVIQECIADDTTNRTQANIEHIIPLYANVITLQDFVEQTVGLEKYADIIKQQAKKVSLSLFKQDLVQPSSISYVANCGRSGHMALYMSHLLEKTEWQPYPTQPWYEDAIAGTLYRCPLGKKILAFCDEPQFSDVSMFLKGREWLDEKDKLYSIANDIMPDTFVYERGQWRDGKAPPQNNDNSYSLHQRPWFVKECQKNGGRAIDIYPTSSECLAGLGDSKSEDGIFVVQPHVPHPLLTQDGRKCHLKMYALLISEPDGDDSLWTLHTYRDVFLCTSSQPWTSDSIDEETQITIRRDYRLREGQSTPGQMQWSGWPGTYEKCKDRIRTVVKRAVDEGKLRGRSGKKQFEIFSADFLVDTSLRPWLIEFNFSPVLFDPQAGQELTTKGLRRYQDLYDKYGEEAQVNDRQMIRDVVEILFTDNQRCDEESLWDEAGELRNDTSKPSTHSQTRNPRKEQDHGRER